MKREQRLRRPADFQRVRATALAPRGWPHPLLVLYAAPNDLPLSRVGVTVGKRVAKSAVVRNRVRRRIREAVRQDFPSLRAGHDLVFVARPASAEAPWLAVREAVESVLRRGRLWPAPRDASAAPVATRPSSSSAGAS